MKDEEMTDEEMAEEIANKRCHEIGCFGHCNFSSPKHHRCGEWHREYNCALEGLKAGRPQWHDLRKDPTDLPKGYAENTRFLCSVKGETLFLIRYGSFWQGNFEVDAWCEIPTFDKE